MVDSLREVKTKDPKNVISKKIEIGKKKVRGIAGEGGREGF